MIIKSMSKCLTVAAPSGFRSSARRVVEWSSDLNKERSLSEWYVEWIALDTFVEPSLFSLELLCF